jgi:hypothetical protein
MKATEISNPSAKEEFLRGAYSQALSEHGWRVRSFKMINKHNQTQYYLFFTTKYWLGMLVMKRAMWRAAPDGDFEYSDLTDTKPKLFEISREQEYVEDLATLIYRKHAGNSVSIDKILKEDVAWHPTCIDRHLRAALKFIEYTNNPSGVTAVKLEDGRKRKNNTYPEKCIITFRNKFD